MENDNSNNPIKDVKQNEITDSPETSIAPETISPSEQILGEKKKSKFSLKNFKFTRNTILVLVLVVLLIAVGVFAFLMTRSNNKETTNSKETVQPQEKIKQIGASILLDEGSIEIVSKDTGEWQDANSTTTIEEGAELRTVGATSRAVVGFDDGSALRLDANSQVVIEEMNTERIVIKHVNGYTYNRVMPSESLTYVVTSENAQYEALGTAFRTASTGDEQSIEVYHSSIVETNTNKKPIEGEKLIVKNKSKPSENGTIVKLDIEKVKSDSFMEWNRNLDVNEQNYKDSLGFLSDVTAPEISLDKSDGAVILLEPNANEGTIEITGKTERGARLTVESKSSANSSPSNVTIADDGSFKTAVLSAPIGNSVFEFITKDRVGNTTAKSLRVTFQRKSQPVAGNAVSFVLSSTITTDKLQLSWKLNGVEAKDGFKVVYEKDNSSPVFKQGAAVASFTKDISASIKLSDFTIAEASYYVKVCIYDAASNTCGQYSNSVKYDKP